MNQIDRYADPIDVDFAPVRAGELAVVDDTAAVIEHLDLVIRENPGIENWMNDSEDVVALWHETKAEVQEIVPPAINTFTVDWDAVEHHLATNHHVNLQIDNSYTDNSTHNSHDITSYTYDNLIYYETDDHSLTYTDNSSYVEEGDTVYVDNSTYAPVVYNYYVDQSDNSVIWVDFDGTSEGQGSYNHTENHTHINGWIFFYVGVVVAAIAVCCAGFRDHFYAPTITPAQEVQPWQ